MIVPDTRGHGRSSNPGGTLTYPMLGRRRRRPLPSSRATEAGDRRLQRRRPDRSGDRHAPSGPPGALVAGGAILSASPSSSARGSATPLATAPDVDVDRFKRDHAEWAAWLEQLYGPEKWKTVLAQVKPMWATEFSYSTDELARIVAPTAGPARRPRRNPTGRGSGRIRSAGCLQPNWRWSPALPTADSSFQDALRWLPA